MTKLIAWHGNPELKEVAIAKMRAHRDADELVQGYGYWEDGKGCAVGCLIESNDHMKYEKVFGIPVILAYLEDRIFEGLPKKLAREWPERFLNAIPVGVDLSLVGWSFQRDMLRAIQIPDSADLDVQNAILLCREAVEQSADLMDLYSRGFTDHDAAESAWSAAESAAEAAESAAPGHRIPAESGRSAAWSAAWSAESAAYERMADILIRHTMSTT